MQITHLYLHLQWFTLGPWIWASHHACVLPLKHTCICTLEVARCFNESIPKDRHQQTQGRLQTDHRQTSSRCTVVWVCVSGCTPWCAQGLNHGLYITLQSCFIQRLWGWEILTRCGIVGKKWGKNGEAWYKVVERQVPKGMKGKYWVRERSTYFPDHLFHR